MMPKFLSCCLFCVVINAVAAAADWPQWRGPLRTGETAADERPWPAQLNTENLKQQWSVALGSSYSGPVIVGDRVFTTETVDKQFEVVRALDRETGKELWQARWEGAMTVPFFAASNGSWIRSTPACDGPSLYVAGMRDVLVCLDTQTGQERWRTDFVAKLGSELPSFGFVCSPLVDGNDVYVQAGGGVVKLNKTTGEILWRTLDDGGGMWGSAFSSPFIAELQGVRQLLVQTREKLCGVNLENGMVLWEREIPAFRGMNIITPVVFNGKILTSTYGGSSLLLEPKLENGTWTVAEVWQNKLQGYMSTPVLVGDRAYLHLRNQRFACLNLSTGVEDWITTPFGKYWSLVRQGERLLALDEEGELRLIQASPQEFQLVDEVHISDEPAWGHLAVSENQIFIRTLNQLTAYQWE
jgi:outer membrane protein assembly factor BamB